MIECNTHICDPTDIARNIWQPKQQQDTLLRFSLFRRQGVACAPCHLVVGTILQPHVQLYSSSQFAKWNSCSNRACFKGGAASVKALTLQKLRYMQSPMRICCPSSANNAMELQYSSNRWVDQGQARLWSLGSGSTSISKRLWQPGCKRSSCWPSTSTCWVITHYL